MGKQLYAIVHALKPSEKRYFRQFSQRHILGKENLYLRLFDGLLQQKQYDETGLRALFTGEKCLDQFASFKSYLQKNILRSLRAYNAENRGQVKLNQQLLDIEWLYNRGQFELCGRMVRKGKKLAEQMADLGNSLLFLAWERKLIKRSLPKGAAALLQTIGYAEKDVLASLQEEQLMNELNDQLFILSQETLGKTRKQKV